MPESECLICSMEEADPASRVFLDELWAAEVAPGYEVPGWFFLRSRRHAEKLTGLDDAETASFGRHTHDLISAIEQVTGAPAVYMLSFGENYLHFHALIAAAASRCRRSCAGARCCNCWPRGAMRLPCRPRPGTSGSPMRRLSVAASTPPWADREDNDHQR